MMWIGFVLCVTFYDTKRYIGEYIHFHILAVMMRQ